MILEKTTETHTIAMQVGERVASQAILAQFHNLGLTLKPNQKRTCMGENFCIQVTTNWKFTPEQFFADHMEFMDSLVSPGMKEN